MIATGNLIIILITSNINLKMCLVKHFTKEINRNQWLTTLTFSPFFKNETKEE